MTIYGKSDKVVLADLGSRLKQERLRRNISQQELAMRAGLNRTTIGDLERGASVSTLTLVQVLRALSLLAELATFIPESGPSPLELAKRQGQQRQRASGRRGQAKPSAEEDDPSW